MKPSRSITKGEEKMTKTLILSLSLAASSLAFSARAQDVRQYTDGPVTDGAYESKICERCTHLQQALRIT